MNWKRLFDSFIPQRKCEPEKDLGSALLTSLAPAGLSAVGSIVSSLFGQSKQEEENQKNRDFALEMWNKNNEYNTPLNQRKRLEEAGYNPYLFASDASAAGQSVQPSTPSSAPLPNYDMGLDGASRILQNGLQMEANIEEQHASAMEKIYGVLFDAYSKGGQDLYNQTLQSLAPTLERFDWSNSPLAQQLDNTIRSQVLDNGSKELENGLLEIEKKWSDTLYADKHLLNSDEHKQFVRTLRKIASEIKLINAQSDKTRAEKDKLVVEKVGAILDNGMKGLDFQIKKDVKDDIIDEYGFNADKAGYEALNSYKTAKYGTLEKLMPFGHQQELIDDPDDSRIYKRVIQRHGRNKLKHN